MMAARFYGLRIFLAAAVLCAGAVAASTAQAAGRPNVLFIICDDLNCDLGAYGHKVVKSPNIDRLAERGVRFERAYCQYPLCGPSRASFMTGMYPDQTLIQQNAIRIRERLPDVVSMSQLFRKHGYTAARVGKIYHYNVPADIGNDGHDDPASWETTFNPIGRDKTDEAKVFTLVPGKYGGTLSWLAADGTDDEQTDGIGAAAAIRLLEGYAKEKTPFFLAVGFYRPHTPYVSPRKYFDMYPVEGITVPPTPEGYFETLPQPARRALLRRPEQVNLPDELARQVIQAYYGSITFVDGQVGRVVDAVDRLGLADDTIIVFTSDHGYHMGEHGGWQKTTLFENATRVPLIVSVPGTKNGGKSVPSPVEMIDLYPTLAELCGLPLPEHLSGVSMKPALESVSTQTRDSALTQFTSGYTLRTPRYRYTEWGRNGSQGAELYDHESDPQEMKNLADSAEHAQVKAELAAQLRRRIGKAQQTPPGLKQISPAGAK